MGLGKPFLEDLIALKRSGALDDCRRVIEIGAQQIADSLILAPELADAIKLFNGRDLHLEPVGAQNFSEHAPPGRLLWQAIGMQSRSLDLVGGDLRIDLNRGRVPFRYRRHFDLAVNAGTTEHVVNQGNAFAAIHGLIRKGGMMYHIVPSAGHVDHGFFGYQPKFFHRLAAANDYETVHFAMVDKGLEQIPSYIHDDNAKVGLRMSHDVARANLRIALRKQHDRPFKFPMDG